MLKSSRELNSVLDFLLLKSGVKISILIFGDNFLKASEKDQREWRRLMVDSFSKKVIECLPSSSIEAESELEDVFKQVAVLVEYSKKTIDPRAYDPVLFLELFRIGHVVNSLIFNKDSRANEIDELIEAINVCSMESRFDLGAEAKNQARAQGANSFGRKQSEACIGNVGELVEWFEC